LLFSLYSLIENPDDLARSFKKWVWLTRFFSNRDLFNTLIDAIDTNQRQLPFQTDSGIQEILDSHRNLEEVYNSKIKHEYEVGSEVRFEVEYKIAHLRGFRFRDPVYGDGYKKISKFCLHYLMTRQLIIYVMRINQFN